MGYFTISKSHAACVPPKENIEIRHSGQYHRMHPSGNYFIYTSGNSANLVDITDRSKPKDLRTDLKLETYPVESANGGWSLLASPLSAGGQGMNFFNFNDVLNGQQGQVKPVYKDQQFGEWYHSTAELPGSTVDNKKVRMLLYSNRRFKDYNMKIGSNGAVDSATTLQTGQICDNIFKPFLKTEEQKTKYLLNRDAINRLEIQLRNLTGDEAKELSKQISQARLNAEGEYYGPEYVENRKKRLEITNKIDELNSVVVNGTSSKDLEARRSEISQIYQNSRNNTEREQLAKEYNEIEVKLRTLRLNNPNVKRINELSSEAQVLDNDLWIIKDGKQFANPVLSKDGTLVAGLVGSKLEVYKIKDDNSCELVGKPEHRASKVSFSYPEKGKLPKIVYTAESASSDFNRKVITYDLEKKITTVISSNEDKGAYYPGFTKDGRVMYKIDTGISIVDPEQINNAGARSCAKLQTPRTQNNSGESSNSSAQGNQ